MDTDTRKKVTIGVGAAALFILVIVISSVIAAARRPAVLNAALTKLAEETSYHARAELKMRLSARLRGRERPFTRLTVRVEGDVSEERERPELTGTLFGEARGRGNVFFVNGDVRILSDTVAFNLKNLPVFINPSGSLVNRWTYVDVPLFETRNREHLPQLASLIRESVSYQGKHTINGRSTYHFSGHPSPETEDQLVQLLRKDTSGNRTFDVIARLLAANNISQFDIYIDPSSKEIVSLRANFVRPLGEGKTFDFATLTVAFTDYGKGVVIDRPPRQAHAKPDVFARIFGSGDVERVD